MSESSNHSTTHTHFMSLALAEAERAYLDGEVPVGAIIVDPSSNTVVASSGNRTNKDRNGIRHCEFICLTSVIAQFPENFKNLVLYVTVEPCIMCAAAYRIMGFSEIFFGCFNDRFGGCGSVLDVASSPEPATNGNSLPPLRVTGGILEAAAIDLLKKFYARGNPKAPPAKRHRPLIVPS